MMNLLETSLRVPLVIRPAPNDPRFGGGRANIKVYPHTIELLDLFPTIVSLANLPPPPKSWDLPGTDLTLGMVHGGVVKPMDAAFGQITRCVNCSLACEYLLTLATICDSLVHTEFTADRWPFADRRRDGCGSTGLL